MSTSSPDGAVQYEPWSPQPGQQVDESETSAPGRSYVAPVLHIMETVDSNPAFAQQQSGAQADTVVSGDLALHHVWRHALLNLLYQGGASFYSGGQQYNSWYQNLGFQQTFTGRRSTFSFGDHFSYLPDSGFGFSGFAPVSYPGMQPSYGTEPITAPLQSILTSYATSYENTVDGQWKYRLTSRSNVSLSGSYGVLQYNDSGFYNSNSYGAGASFEHQIGSHSSLGVSYAASWVRYPEETTQIDIQSLALEFKHSLGKRYALQLGAGPQFVSYDFGGADQRSVDPYGFAGLTAHWGRVDLGLMYSKAVSAGSGVMLGSKADIVVLTAARRLSRFWRAAANFSYAHNSPLQPSGGADYNTEAAGVSLSRNIGRTASFFAQYSLQNQNTTAGTGSVLAGNLLRNTFGLGFSWSPRNIPVN